MRTASNKTTNALVIAALGVVFGDIGTSPLYAFREAFAHGAIQTSAFNILGILSLMMWSLTLIVSIKYLLFVMRADNKGEGGILALTALLSFLRANEPSRRAPLILVGIFGAALLFGDGVLTPAVTILGAVEGLNVATPLFAPYVVPIAITILVIFFWAQHHGTTKIGLVFGPIIFVWFLTIGIFGLISIIKHPVVLEAFNPLYAINFCLSINLQQILIVLGAVFLTVTGAEALYADMGHFGASPIRRAWSFIAFPGLMLNYLGQGALLISDPAAAVNPFYYLVPNWALYPMVLLSTMAAVIASQALVTGVFSITQQAIHLGYLPRLRVVHTSMSTMGQIYLPLVNWALLGGTIFLVAWAGSSARLVSAYGIAVSLTMLITTVLACIVARRLWNWHPLVIGTLFVFMFALDALFFSANALKIHHGGYIPLCLAVGLFIVMTTWKKGRVILFEYLKSHTIPFEQFLEEIRTKPPANVSGTAIFMTAEPTGIPLALLHNVRHNKVLHARNIFLTVFVEEVPFIKRKARLEVVHLRDGFYRMSARYGFMEKPDINHIFSAAKDKDLPLDMADTIFFLGKETIIATQNKGMAIWREKLFSFMSKNSEGAILFFNLPRQQVVELGVQIEL